jgi:hypothetical protein
VKQASESAGLFNYSSGAEDTARLSKARSIAQSHLWPLLCCVVAGFALSFTPVVIARMKTGMWALLQPELEYYLQIAGQAYYDHPSYISDPWVPNGVTFYSWLLFVPPVWIARALGLSLFSVGLIWMLLGCVGVGTGLYFVFWRFLRRPWTAAGLSIFCLSNLRFTTATPLNYHFNAILFALLLRPHGSLDLNPFPYWEWQRVPNPALVLPFLFLQILAVSMAFERPKGLNVWLSGLAFGLLFYVYFYAWTIAAAALCIAMLFDAARRKVYGQTLLIGLASGLPELVHVLRIRDAASIEALTRFALLSPYPNNIRGVPWFSLVAVTLAGVWIWTTKKPGLIYLWSLSLAGILLSCSHLFTGIFLHSYHWTVLMMPIRAILILILIATLVIERNSRLPALTWAFPTLVAIYFIGGVYLSAILLTRSRVGAARLEHYANYRSQRLVSRVNSLTPNSMIAGDETFCELAAIGENQRALSDMFLNVSMAVDNDTWRSRFALNEFLSGTTNRLEFEKKAHGEAETGLWTVVTITPELVAPFMLVWDEIVHNPDRFLDTYHVRYVALPIDRPVPAYLHKGWTLLQPGPYWQLWERKVSSEKHSEDQQARLSGFVLDQLEQTLSGN